MTISPTVEGGRFGWELLGVSFRGSGTPDGFGIWLVEFMTEFLARLVSR